MNLNLKLSPCPLCKGARLNQAALSCKVKGYTISDIGRLLTILNRLVDGGNTVVIEHHLNIIRNADWIIDMGPQGGHRE
jgi:excinuclease UvrABC ATPase subunit